MDFALSDEQRAIVETVRAFVDRELVPHEDEVEQLDDVTPELRNEIRTKALNAGLYAANMPEDVGGGGLDAVSLALVERELGRTSFALHHFVARPSRILMGCTGDQIDNYLLPTVRGEKQECLAITEPGAGSDVRGMSTTAKRDGDEWVINGTKHFISHAEISDYIILFAATGEEESSRGPRKLISSFLVDTNLAGLTITKGSPSVSHRGYHHCELHFDNVRAPGSALLGEEGKGFRPDGSVARSHPPGGRRKLRRSRAAGARRGARRGRPAVSSSARRSASSRACPSSSPTPRSRLRRPSC